MSDQMAEILKQAQKMKKDMARIQDDLKERVVEGTSGGGMVSALVSGSQDLLKIELLYFALQLLGSLVTLSL